MSKFVSHSVSSHAGSAGEVQTCVQGDLRCSFLSRSQAHIPQPLFHSMCKIWIASRGFIGLRQQLKIDGVHVGET